MQFMGLRDVFNEMDRSGDGNSKLGQDEFVQGLQAIEPGLSDVDAACQFNEADADNTGQILFSEFCTFVASKRRLLSNQSKSSTSTTLVPVDL